eukprot:548856_1
MASSNSAFILAAKRTPFGRFGGGLKGLNVVDLGVLASRAAIGSFHLSSKEVAGHVDHVFFGSALPSLEGVYLSRHVGLKAGCPVSAPSLTVNRLCGTGFESVIQGAQLIHAGRSHLSLCGGAESMSSSPFLVNGNDVRWGVALGKGINQVDSLWAGLTDSHALISMGATADNLAKRYGISREACDEYALRSALLWAGGHAAGAFDAEMASVEVMEGIRSKTIDADEHPRPDSTAEQLASLKPVFDVEGVVTAGNSSGVCDGAGALLVGSESVANKLEVEPLVRIVSWAQIGCDPSIMGIGPVGAVRSALDEAGVTLKDMDFVEINEAFAAQVLSVEKELSLDRKALNGAGGAIAMGHPLGASGSRILAHLAHKLKNKGSGAYGVGAACIGGGQGIACVLQAI